MTVNDALKRAIGFHQGGRYAEAERLYRDILEMQPAHVDANHNLGVLKVQTGYAEEAWPYFKVAFEAYPDHVPFRQSYLNALVEMFGRGEYTRVEQLARELTDGHPEVAHAWKLLGAALHKMERTVEALPYMEKAVALLPDDAQAHSNLGVALRDLELLPEAENMCLKAIELAPESADAYYNLGNAQMDQGKLLEAEASYKKVLELDPGNSDTYNNLGLVEEEAGNLEEAIRHFTKAIALNPQHAKAQNNLGMIYEAQGDLVMAENCYREALSAKSDMAESHWNLARIKRFIRCDARMEALNRLYEAGGVGEEGRAYICFALGKAHEDLREYDEAFHYYLEGNRLRKKQLGYSIEQDRNLFGRVKAAFDKLSVTAPVGFAGAHPMLIVGMPRSGTSLVEQILASHSQVYGAGELTVLDAQVLKYFRGDRGIDLSETSRQITAHYFGVLDLLARGHRVVTDKMPQNFLWIGFLLLANPDIKVIHVVRDPMATCWSIYKLYFSAKGLGFAYDMADLGEYYKMYEDLMRFWHEKFPGRIYDLDYERLTEHQEEETRKLLAYCDLSWEEACLEFEKTERAVRTASATQVREKIYRGSSEAWRNFEKHLNPLFRLLF